MEFEATGQASGVEGKERPECRLRNFTSGLAARIHSLLVEGKMLSVLLIRSQKLAPNSIFPRAP